MLIARAGDIGVADSRIGVAPGHYGQYCHWLRATLGVVHRMAVLGSSGNFGMIAFRRGKWPLKPLTRAEAADDSSGWQGSAHQVKLFVFAKVRQRGPSSLAVFPKHLESNRHRCEDLAARTNTSAASARVSGFSGPSTLLLRHFPRNGGRSQHCHSTRSGPAPALAALGDSNTVC